MTKTIAGLKIIKEGFKKLNNNEIGKYVVVECLDGKERYVYKNYSSKEFEFYEIENHENFNVLKLDKKIFAELESVLLMIQYLRN